MLNWLRVAPGLAFAVAGMACQELPRPTELTRARVSQSVPRPPEGPANSSTRIQIGERSHWFENHLHATLTNALARAEAVMAPLCAPNCGQVTLLADPNATAIAQCQVEQLGVSSLISYKSDDEDWVWLQFDSTSTFYALAHEYGHHLDFITDFHTEHGRWIREIRADVLAGCALQLDRADITKALTLKMDPDDGSDGSDALTPPTRWSREAISQGAEACRASTTPTLAELAVVAQRVAERASAGAANRGRSE